MMWIQAVLFLCLLHTAISTPIQEGGRRRRAAPAKQSPTGMVAPPSTRYWDDSTLIVIDCYVIWEGKKHTYVCEYMEPNGETFIEEVGRVQRSVEGDPDRPRTAATDKRSPLLSSLRTRKSTDDPERTPAMDGHHDPHPAFVHGYSDEWPNRRQLNRGRLPIREKSTKEELSESEAADMRSPDSDMPQSRDSLGSKHDKRKYSTIHSLKINGPYQR